MRGRGEMEVVLGFNILLLVFEEMLVIWDLFEWEGIRDLDINFIWGGIEVGIVFFLKVDL